MVSREEKWLEEMAEVEEMVCRKCSHFVLASSSFCFAILVVQNWECYWDWGLRIVELARICESQISRPFTLTRAFDWLRRELFQGGRRSAMAVPPIVGTSFPRWGAQNFERKGSQDSSWPCCRCRVRIHSQYYSSPTRSIPPQLQYLVAQSLLQHPTRTVPHHNHHNHHELPPEASPRP